MQIYVWNDDNKHCDRSVYKMYDTVKQKKMTQVKCFYIEYLKHKINVYHLLLNKYTFILGMPNLNRPFKRSIFLPKNRYFESIPNSQILIQIDSNA